MRPAGTMPLLRNHRGRSDFISFFFFTMATTPQGIRPPAPKDETASASATPPVAVFKFGSVSAAVFADEVKTAKGTATVHNVSLRRSYQDAQKAWHSTHTLRPSDLLPAAL